MEILNKQKLRFTWNGEGKTERRISIHNAFSSIREARVHEKLGESDHFSTELHRGMNLALVKNYGSCVIEICHYILQRPSMKCIPKECSHQSIVLMHNRSCSADTRLRLVPRERSANLFFLNVPVIKAMGLKAETSLRMAGDLHTL